MLWEMASSGVRGVGIGGRVSVFIKWPMIGVSSVHCLVVRTGTGVRRLSGRGLVSRVGSVFTEL